MTHNHVMLPCFVLFFVTEVVPEGSLLQKIERITPMYGQATVDFMDGQKAPVRPSETTHRSGTTTTPAATTTSRTMAPSTVRSTTHDAVRTSTRLTPTESTPGVEANTDDDVEQVGCICLLCTCLRKLDLYIEFTSRPTENVHLRSVHAFIYYL